MQVVCAVEWHTYTIYKFSVCEHDVVDMTLVTYGRGEDVTDGFTLVPVMNAFGQLDVKHVVTLQTKQNNRQQRKANEFTTTFLTKTAVHEIAHVRTFHGKLLHDKNLTY